MRPNPSSFLPEKWHGVSKPTESFAGKTILITSANTGIGFEAASQYAALNAEKVVLAVRDLEKGDLARLKIESKTQAKNVEVWQVDMNSFVSIQSVVSQVEKKLPRLDIAILNAGITTAEYKLSTEGWESHLQVNVLGRALLGLLLLPKMRASSQLGSGTSHLLIVTSEAHRWLEANDIPDTAQYGGNLLLAMNDAKGYEPFVQYARSKLLAMYIARSLASLATNHDRKAEVIVTAVCPGPCKSDLMRDLEGRSFSQTMKLTVFDLAFNKPTEQGAWSYVWASLLGMEGHGKWFKTTRLVKPGELVTGPVGAGLQNQAWNEILEVLSSLYAKVPDVKELVEGRWR